MALLPENLRSLVPPTPDKSAFFSALTSGQCLCAAYNTGVRRSRKPWGYISADSVHDIAFLERSADGVDGDEKAKIGWTFRRIDNLRLWAGYVSVPPWSIHTLTIRLAQRTQASLPPSSRRPVYTRSTRPYSSYQLAVAHTFTRCISCTFSFWSHCGLLRFYGRAVITIASEGPVHHG